MLPPDVAQRLRVLAAASTLLLAAPACSLRRPAAVSAGPGLDRSLSAFSYIEEGNLVILAVGTRAAAIRERQAYMPLEVAVANVGLSKLTLSRESFSLVDEAGRRYPVADPSELLHAYRYLDVDRKLAVLPDQLLNAFAALTPYPGGFTPSRTTTRMVRDRVTLPRSGYLLDFLYFPVPEDGVRGRVFELFMESPDLPDPVFIRFRVR